MRKKTRKATIVFFAAGFALFCAASPTVGDHAQKKNVVNLNVAALEYAKKLVSEGQVVVDGRGAWSQDQPPAQEENKFIRQHGFGEYAKWHLGVDERHPENSKAHFKFPYGDFQNVHRCALLAAKSRAGQYHHYDIEKATIELIREIEKRGR